MGHSMNKIMTPIFYSSGATFLT